MEFIALLIYILILIIFCLILFAIMQLKMAGIQIKDFRSFIDANKKLDKLYRYAKRYDLMSPQQQLVYLLEAERVFEAFDKIPSMVWEEEHDKYEDVLNAYKDIKILRWNNNKTREEVKK